jgi:hypothetical protein
MGVGVGAGVGVALGTGVSVGAGEGVREADSPSGVGAGTEAGVQPAAIPSMINENNTKERRTLPSWEGIIPAIRRVITGKLTPVTSVVTMNRL